MVGLTELVRPEDAWIVPVSLLGIILSLHTRSSLRTAGWIIMILTTFLVGAGYGLVRGMIHAVVLHVLRQLLLLLFRATHKRHPLNKLAPAKEPK